MAARHAAPEYDFDNKYRADSKTEGMVEFQKSAKAKWNEDPATRDIMQKHGLADQDQSDETEAAIDPWAPVDDESAASKAISLLEDGESIPFTDGQPQAIRPLEERLKEALDTAAVEKDRMAAAQRGIAEDRERAEEKYHDAQSRVARLEEDLTAEGAENMPLEDDADLGEALEGDPNLRTPEQIISTYALFGKTPPEHMLEAARIAQEAKKVKLTHKQEVTKFDQLMNSEDAEEARDPLEKTIAEREDFENQKTDNSMKPFLQVKKKSKWKGMALGHYSPWNDAATSPPWGREELSAEEGL